MKNGATEHMSSSDKLEGDEARHVSSYRISQTAKLLTNAKISLLEDLNVDNLTAGNTEKSGAATLGKVLNEQNKGRPLKILSKASRIRADRVRSYIQFYYHLIEKEITTGGTGLYKGVEGKYNPLQVIRNRKIKKKLHENPKNEIAFMKPPVLAIRDFSKHPDRENQWFVGVNETTADLAWRVSHWDELRRPDGKPWFKSKSKRRSQSAAEVSRAYKGERPPNHSRNSSSILLRQTSSNWELPQISVESVDGPVTDGPRGRESKFDKALEKTKRLSRSALQSKSASQQHIIYDERNPDSRPLGNAHNLYLTPTEPVHHPNIADIPINSFRTRTAEERSSESSNRASEEFLELSEPFNIPKESVLQKQYNELIYLRCTFQVVRHRQETSRIIQARTSAKASVFVPEDPTQICKPAEDVLHEYENELVKALKTCDIWKSRLLNDYSIRVETLISTSDRVLSDINSTLTLRLKMLQEKMDKFGTLRRMNREPLRVFLYRVLEVAITLLFWMIWVIFIIVKSGKIMILSLLRVVRWITW